MSPGNCQEDSGNAEGDLEAKKTSSLFRKLKASQKKCVSDTALSARLQSVKKAIGKFGRKIASGIRRIRSKRFGSEKMFSSWRSGLQRAADRTRSTTQRIGRACYKRFRSLRIPLSWRSGQQRAADRIGGAVGRIGGIYGERSSGTWSWSSRVSTDTGESLQTEADDTSEDITDSEVLVCDEEMWWSL
jgi:hypothetical protein